MVSESLVGERPGGVFDHPYRYGDSEKGGECHRCDCHSQTGGESPVEEGDSGGRCA